MGEVVKLKPKFPADNAARRLKRLEAKVKELKAHNKILIKLLRDPYNDYVREAKRSLELANEKMWIANGRELIASCTCTPTRSDFLRAIARE